MTTGSKKAAQVVAGVDANKVLSLCDAIIHGTAAQQYLIRDMATELRHEAEAALLAEIERIDRTAAVSN